MSDDGLVRRRNLPHIDVEGKPYFITACLKGSLSAIGLRQIRLYREALESRSRPKELSISEWELQKHKLVFKQVDMLLDGQSPVQHFKDDRLAEIVQDAFLFFANARYQLFAFVVMPSHHHWLFLPDEKWSLEFAISQKDKVKRRTPREAISHSIQSFTSNECNRLLGQSGEFWQDETFDHYARNEQELWRIIQYIEQNPVVAGLVSHAADYRWSSARIRDELKIPFGAPIPGLR